MKYSLKTSAPRPKLDLGRDLNPQQRAVVEADPGEILVLAGAGTGKTRTLTYRVARLVGAGWDPTNQDRSLAHELDFVATYRPLKQLFIQPAYALVLPLGGGQAIAGSEPQHLLYLWMIAKY